MYLIWENWLTSKVETAAGIAEYRWSCTLVRTERNDVLALMTDEEVFHCLLFLVSIYAAFLIQYTSHACKMFTNISNIQQKCNLNFVYDFLDYIQNLKANNSIKRLKFGCFYNTKYSKLKTTFKNLPYYAMKMQLPNVTSISSFCYEYIDTTTQIFASQ